MGDAGAGDDLILASASPRRKDILAQAGLSFRIIESDVDERVAAVAGLPPAELACRLALLKAEAVARRAGTGVVLGADTLVVADGRILGKPRDEADARDMLRRLAGRTHSVITGVAVVDAASGRTRVSSEETLVTMRPLDEGEILAYVATGEPGDKAGAYAIQGRGAVLVTRVNGCFYNVVGLPLAKTVLLLREFGIEVLRGSGGSGK